MLEIIKSFETHKIFDIFQLFWNFWYYGMLGNAKGCYGMLGQMAALVIVVISKVSASSYFLLEVLLASYSHLKITICRIESMKELGIKVGKNLWCAQFLFHSSKSQKGLKFEQSGGRGGTTLWILISVCRRLMILLYVTDQGAVHLWRQMILALFDPFPLSRFLLPPEVWN